MRHQEILHRCFRCGYCKLPGNYVDFNCPAYLSFGFETYSPGGRIWLLRAWLDGKIKTSPRLAEILFSCTACGNCVTQCAFPQFRDQLLPAFLAGKETLLESGKVLPQVRDLLTRIQLHGNAFGKSAAVKDRLLPALGGSAYQDQEYLFFIDDMGWFDPRGQAIAAAVLNLMRQAGVSVGVLSQNLQTDGNEVLAMGETLLFEELAVRNIERLNQNKVTKIITLSPHSFHALKNEYPKLGGSYQVFHYTQVLAFAMGKLRLSKNATETAVTLHDPCYLGRHNQDYESTRMILRALPGVTLVEMDRVRQNALCCGGGGGNAYTDILSGGDESPARVRVREAAKTGAQVLAVACPACALMLEDAIKVENLDHQVRVLEISEIIQQRIEEAG